MTRFTRTRSPAISCFKSSPSDGDLRVAPAQANYPTPVGAECAPPCPSAHGSSCRASEPSSGCIRHLQVTTVRTLLQSCINPCRFCISFACIDHVTDADVHKMTFLADLWTPEKHATNCFSDLGPTAHPDCGTACRPGLADRRPCLLSGGGKPCLMRVGRPYFDKRLAAAALRFPGGRFPK